MELHELAADRVKWGAEIKVKGVATTQGDEQFGRPKEMGMKVPRLHMHWVMARGQGWKFTHIAHCKRGNVLKLSHNA